MKPIDFDAILSLELETHPHLELLDIYKLMYQSYFGPSHIVKDRFTVAKNIEIEYMNMQQGYYPLFHDIGEQPGYIRVSLSVLDKAYRTSPALFMATCTKFSDLILASCYIMDTELSVADIWKQNYSTILKYYTPTVDEAETVSEFARDGNIPSHSDKYRMHYNPHYRLVYKKDKHSISELEQTFLLK